MYQELNIRLNTIWNEKLLSTLHIGQRPEDEVTGLVREIDKNHRYIYIGPIPSDFLYMFEQLWGQLDGSYNMNYKVMQ